MWSKRASEYQYRLETEKKEFDKIIENYRGKNDYDCIVPFSGGKDSTWTLYYLVKEYKIKPLVIRFDHGFLRNNLNENALKTFRSLGVDVINFTPNWKVVRKLMLQSLLEKVIFAGTVIQEYFLILCRLLCEFNIPLVIWGEPSSEYTSYYSYEQDEKVDEKRFNRFINLGINADDMYLRLGGKIDKRDLNPYSYPPLKDLRKINYNSLCLGSYIPWDVKKQSEIITKELDWQGDEVENVPEIYSYEKLNATCKVRDYLNL